jgi:2-iminobutanoate/2-iminopropanoate deaminase
MSTPIGPYTPVVAAGPWLICSGQLGLRQATEGEAPALVTGGAVAQLTQALANADGRLSTQGAGLPDVVKYGAINEAYVAGFGDHRPARSVVCVSALPMGAAVEIELWAYVESR